VQTLVNLSKARSRHVASANGLVGWLLEREGSRGSRAFSFFSVLSFFHSVFFKTSPSGCAVVYVQPGGRNEFNSVESEKAHLYTDESAGVVLVPQEIIDIL
jgi:hypothetical protein